MRLLFVTYRFPVYDGDAPSNTVLNLVKYFSASHEISLVGLARRPVPLDRRRVLEQYCHRVEIVVWPKWKGAIRALQGLASTEPFQMAYCRSNTFAAKIRQVAVEEQIDLAFAYHLRSGPPLLELSGIPRVLAIHPVQVLHFGRRHELTRNPLLRAVYGMEYRRLVGYEAQLALRFDSCSLISARDRDAIDPDHILRNVCVNPHGTDVVSFAPPQETVRAPNNIAFCGSLSIDTNVDAVLYFHDQILPRVWQKRPDVLFTVVGKTPPQRIRRLARDPRVEITGYVPDVRPYLWKATVGIDPIRMAAGMQNKLIEGLAAGLPMVITPEANEGILAPQGTAVRIGQNASEFAGHILHLLDHPAEAAALAKEGMSFVRAHWSWEHHFRLLEAHFESLAAGTKCVGI